MFYFILSPIDVGTKSPVPLTVVVCVSVVLVVVGVVPVDVRVGGGLLAFCPGTSRFIPVK